ncbi:tryptophan--tRNA ligase [Candidatus Parcubacteria bacterium]|nr:tryptophan--tRNA ligase [Candidatus Parcubacteria bacterium]
MKQKLITGFKPSGDIHLGNYLGAMKHLPELEEKYESFIFIPNYHALNSVQDAEKLSHLTMDAGKAILALGLNPDKTIIFKQSDVPEVCELSWILGSLMPMPLLERAHAYKDARDKNRSINAGVFNYPLLMAADILIYKINIVPVGKDQKQHIEIARTIAQKFNNQFGKFFIEPQEIIRKEVETIIGLDGRKMSKSYNNVIGLFESEEETIKKVMSIKTDSRRPEEPKNPEECAIFALHKHFSKNGLDEIANRYKQGKISYKESKDILAENINKELRQIRGNKKEFDKNEDFVKKVLKDGGKKAREIARGTMKEVRKLVGLL